MKEEFSDPPDQHQMIISMMRGFSEMSDQHQKKEFTKEEFSDQH